jgi:hypothetical protein
MGNVSFVGFVSYQGGHMTGIEPIPIEWIDKVFNCMNEFYGERWSNRYPKESLIDLAKVQWHSALFGLDYDQIKKGLLLCRRHSKDPRVQPPHQLEFFRYAKQDALPDIDYHPDAGKRGDPEIAKDHLTQIRSKLRFA